jgi:hypothetical protein
MLAAQNRHRLWSVLSLWALLALMMPQLLWACPMTGQVGSTPSQACRCAEKDANAPAEDSSATQPHKCCKHVPLPASDTSGHDEHGLLSHAKTISFSLQPFSVASDLFAVPVFELAPPISQTAVFPASISPPLISQHCPASHAGRAPPL